MTKEFTRFLGNQDKLIVLLPADKKLGRGQESAVLFSDRVTFDHEYS